MHYPIHYVCTQTIGLLIYNDRDSKYFMREGHQPTYDIKRKNEKTLRNSRENSARGVYIIYNSNSLVDTQIERNVV